MIEILVKNCLEALLQEQGRIETIENDAIIFGNGGLLNSLSLVRLIVDIEGAVYDSKEKVIILTDDKTLSMKKSPFRTVASLTDLVQSKIDDATK